MRLLAALLFALLLFGQQSNPNIESFEYVWKTIRDKHWDPQLGGVDWQAVHDEFRPRVEKSESVHETRAILTEMLGRLHQSHFGIIPGTAYAELGAGSPTLGGEGTVGIDVRIIRGEAVISSVDPDSPAAKAGVLPGWIVRKVDANEIKPMISQYPHAGESSLRDLTLRRAILLRFNGAVGESAHCSFLDERDQPVYKNIVRAEPRGNLTTLGYLGPARVWFEARQFKAGARKIEYVAFNLFLDPSNLMPEFGSAVESCLKCDGFILDLRGNPGGLGAMATGMASWFIEKQSLLGTLYLRESALKFVINPRANTYGGPLAILVDRTTASTAEILAGGLQDLKRATIFGEQTAAAALPSVIERLPNGDAFQFAIANYVSEGGKALEANGVVPDEPAPWTRGMLLDHRDPALQAAVEWIEHQKTVHEEEHQ